MDGFSFLMLPIALTVALFAFWDAFGQLIALAILLAPFVRWPRDAA